MAGPEGEGLHYHPMMDLRQLRYAVLLAEEGHFGRAAARAFVTQSALSQQIARLESRLGARLFDRGSRGVVPTPAGEILLSRARDILDDIARLEEEAREHGRGLAGTLRVGIFGAGAGELTPLMFDAFRGAFPRAVLQIRELTMSTQVAALVDKTVDVAIIHPLFEEPSLESLPLLEEPRYAAVPARHALAEADELSVRDLADEYFVTARAGTPAPWKAFWSCEDVWGAASPGEIDMDSVNEGLAAVAYLGAVDTVPSTATRFFRHPGVRFIPLRDASRSTVAVVRRRGDDRTLVEAFCRVAVDVADRRRELLADATPPAVVSG